MSRAGNPSGDIIAAIATPPGRGGVGIVRLSGPDLKAIASALLGTLPAPRHARYGPFLEQDGSVIDTGIALYFPAPHSYTGEAVLELQGHGGPVVMDMLLRRTLALGARPARPGEFSERAFLNDKLDLAQAEAVADLIDSSTEQAVRAAQRSLQGAFSAAVGELADQLVELRLYVEASIDFIEEEIDFLSSGDVARRLADLLSQLERVRSSARQGRLLHDGMTVVIAGRPNAGKSSLLNRLAGHEAAIVSQYAGTTRDLLRERIQIDGMPLHIIDTAGLHDSANPIEQEGIRRARAELEKADRILLVVAPDEQEDPALMTLRASFPAHIGLTCIYNKIDLSGAPPALIETGGETAIYLSAKTGAGLELLHQHLKRCMGYDADTGAVFSARRRHLDALERAGAALNNAQTQLNAQPAPELVAEDLRQAQNALQEITGAFSADDLLGRIFSSFCIGK